MREVMEGRHGPAATNEESHIRAVKTIVLYILFAQDIFMGVGMAVV